MDVTGKELLRGKKYFSKPGKVREFCFQSGEISLEGKVDLGT